MICLIISGRLPGLNEYIEAERTKKYAGARMKKEAEQRIEWAAKSQLRGVRFKGPVVMHYTWVEANKSGTRTILPLRKSSSRTRLSMLECSEMTGGTMWTVLRTTLPSTKRTRG